MPVSLDRKSTRLNSSHGSISYAVFCLKKKKIPRNFSHGSLSYASFVSERITTSVPHPACLCAGAARTPSWWRREPVVFFFFFNDTATTEIYTLSLHDALPI